MYLCKVGAEFCPLREAAILYKDCQTGIVALSGRTILPADILKDFHSASMPLPALPK